MTRLPRYSIIKASAGSGKTYRLSGQYIRLLAEGAAPETILATTFTRMAAAEILDRILKRLARGALDEASARKLGAEIGLESFPCSAARSILARLCRSLDLVQVATLDSFFGRLARPLRHVIGLPREPRMTDDRSSEAVRLRGRAFEEALEREDPARAESLLAELFGSKAHALVSELSGEALGEAYELFRETEARAWSVPVPATRLEPARFDALVAKLRAAALAQESKSHAKAMADDADRLAAGDWGPALEKGLVKVVAAGGTQYQKREIDPAIREEIYKPLVGHVRASVAAALHARVTAARQLLEALHEVFLRMRGEAGVAFYSDIPHALRAVISARPEVLLDHFGAVTHVLFDEFQDVSGPQYRILGPLAKRARAEAEMERGSLFAVGDVKQSIYGWRGGLPRIFEHLATDLSIPADAITGEAVNYRSAPVVLAAVNRLFARLASNPALAQAGEAAARWGARFKAHEACEENRSLGGYVSLATAPAEAGDEEGEEGEGGDESGASTLLRAAARLVEETLARDPAREIAVICRTNESCRTVATLLKNRGIVATNEKGIMLGDDPVVGLVLSALELADHPRSTAAAFHLLHSPLARPLGLDSLEPARCGEVSLALRRRFASEGYAAALKGFAEVLAESCDAGSVARLERLLRLAETAGAEELLRPMLFAERIRTTTVPVSESSAVVVTTIHGAKGREYEMVIYPARANELIGSVSRRAFILGRNPATDEIEAVYPRPTMKQRPALPELDAACIEEETRQAEEDLCTVYVAMTRAKRELRILVPALVMGKEKPSTKGLSNPSVATLLRSGLKDEGCDEGYKGGEVLHAAGSEDWWKRRARAAAPGVGAPVRLDALKGSAAAGSTAAGGSAAGSAAAGGAAPTRMRPRISPSRLHGPGSVEAARLFDAASSAAALRGTVLHEWFSRIEWLSGEEPAPGGGERAAIARQVEPSLSDEAIAEMEKAFRAALGRAEVKAILARPGGEVEVLPELPFAVTLGERFVSGRFDRVVIEGSLDAPRSATIYDYKTDDVSGEAIGKRAADYRPQVEEYRRALAAILGLAPERIKAALVFTTPGRVVEVG